MTNPFDKPPFPEHLDEAPEAPEQLTVEKDPTLPVFTGARVRVSRQALGLSINDLADYLGISRRTIMRWERQEQVPEWVGAALDELSQRTEMYTMDLAARAQSVTIYRDGYRDLGDGRFLPESWWHMVIGRAIQIEQRVAPRWYDEETAAEESTPKALALLTTVGLTCTQIQRDLDGEHGGYAQRKATELIASLSRYAGLNPATQPVLVTDGLTALHAPIDIEGEKVMDSGLPRSEWVALAVLAIFAARTRTDFRGRGHAHEQHSTMQAQMGALIRSDEYGTTEQRLKSWVTTAVSPGDMTARLRAIHEIIKRLGQAGLPIDYGALAGDLYDLFDPKAARAVAMRWELSMNRAAPTEEN